MKKLVIILVCMALIGCAEIVTVLDTFYPPDPICNAESVGTYWPEKRKLCVKTTNGYQWIWTLIEPKYERRTK
jgi:hypothetical protein